MDQVIVISWGFYPFSFMPSFCFSHFFSFRMQHYLKVKNTKGTKLQSTVGPINYRVIIVVLLLSDLLYFGNFDDIFSVLGPSL
jgi:hypothetical protein